MQSRIKLIREAYRLDIEEFATRLEIHREWIFAAENMLDSSDIPEEIISKISTTYYIPKKFILGYPYKLKCPVNSWHTDEREDYWRANSKMRCVLTAMFGYCVFSDSDS